MTTSKAISSYISILIVVLSTAFSFAVGGDQRNYLLIAFLAISCFSFFLSFAKHFEKNEIYIYLFCTSLLLCLIRHPETFRFATLCYTLMFSINFAFYLRMLRRGFYPHNQYLTLLKNIIYAYFLVLLIQQFCVIANLPILNFMLGESSNFKLNSLSPEPSHSARILTVLFFSFIYIRELELQRKYRPTKDGITDLAVWFCFFYTMLTMGSALSYFLLLLLIARFAYNSIPILFWTSGATLLVIILYPYFDINSQAIKRAISFTSGLMSENIAYNLIRIDHSASIRVLPSYYYISNIAPLSLDFWFGAGIDYSGLFFPKLIPGVPANSPIGGIFPGLILNHGIISGILLLFMVYKICLFRLWSFQTFLATILLFACGINTQITWLVFVLLATNRYFKHNNQRHILCKQGHY